MLSKAPPIGMSDIVCVYNALVDIQSLDLPSLEIPNISLSKINNALASIGHGYQPSTSLMNQWKELVAMIDRMDIDEQTKANISAKSLQLKDDFLKSRGLL